jgi:hypothetical protein
MYDENHRRIERDVNDFRPPWWGVWMTHLLIAIKESGGDVDAATHLHEWILDHPMFEDVVYREFWVPTVPAPSDDSEEARQRYEKLCEDCFVSVARIVSLSALSHSCTRPSFVLAALSFWDMVFHRKPLT